MQPRVYQDLLVQRLRTSDGDYPDDRTSWVTTPSGPPQRPTYTALFYLDGVEMGRGAGPTRTAAKESAAARALARLPRPLEEQPQKKQPLQSSAPRTEKREEGEAQNANQPTRELQQTRGGLSVNGGSGWRARMAAKHQEQLRRGCENMRVFRQGQTATMLRRDFAALQIGHSWRVGRS